MADVAILVVHAGLGQFEAGVNVHDHYPGGTSTSEAQLKTAVIIISVMHSHTMMYRDSHAPDSGQATRHVEGGCGRQRDG